MALEPCPACARPVSAQARFCVHCHVPISRTMGADLHFDWAYLQRVLGALSRAGRALRERGPSTRLCLFLLSIGLLLKELEGISFFGDSIYDLAIGILLFAFLNFPALLALLLILLRRPAGLYGALPVFVFSLSWSGGLAYMLGEHFSSYLLTLMIAAVSAWGVIASFLEAAGGRVTSRVLAFVAFFLLQLVPLALLLVFSSS